MSYIVNKTNGAVLTTLQDGTTNSDTGLTLIGRNYTSYGEIQNENFVRLLENFASHLPPGESVGFAPIPGQLWWDTDNQRLRVYDGADFVTVSERYVGTTAPTSSKTGDQWWDSTNKQLKVNDGTDWVLISPLYTASQGKSGAIVETVTDGSSATHTVVNTYANNNLISVASYDPSFTTGEYDQFSVINPGITLASNVMIHGTTENALKLGGAWANTFPRTTVRTDFLSDLGVNGNLVLGGANVRFSGDTLSIVNSNLNGNVDLYVNTITGNTRALRINGSTGMVTVSAHPTNTYGVTTKGYTDSIQVALDTSIVSNVASINANVTQLRENIYADLGSNVTVLSAQINALNVSTTDQFTALNSAFTSNVSQINANVAYDASRIATLENTMPTKADLASPAFTGLPLAPTMTAGNNSSVIATTAYVDSADTETNLYINTQIAATQSLAATNLANGLATKANNDSPAFTGSPVAPTPISADNSTKIATTAFVRGAITGPNTRWQGSRYTVSTDGPSGGEEGDFWFQIG
jgi:hypothetical protein